MKVTIIVDYPQVYNICFTDNNVDIIRIKSDNIKDFNVESLEQSLRNIRTMGMYCNIINVITSVNEIKEIDCDLIITNRFMSYCIDNNIDKKYSTYFCTRIYLELCNLLTVNLDLHISMQKYEIEKTTCEYVTENIFIVLALILIYAMLSYQE